MRISIFLIESSAISYCPVCGESLTYRDTCKRVMLLEGWEQRVWVIRRLKCQKCATLHRELPDILVPYKHYAAEVVSGVLDGHITSADEDCADYPCQTTMNRWHHWLMANQLRIDGHLKSIGYRLLGFGEELLKSSMSLLETMRSSNQEWLEKLLRFLYNSGGFLLAV